MTSPIFLHELPIEQLEKMSQEEIEQTIKAEQLYFQHRPKTLYYFAVNGAKTKNNGLVKASAENDTEDDLGSAAGAVGRFGQGKAVGVVGQPDFALQQSFQVGA